MLVQESTSFRHAQIGVHLDLWGILGPFASWEHENLSAGMLVNSKTDSFVLKVIYLVQMS